MTVTTAGAGQAHIQELIGAVEAGDRGRTARAVRAFADAQQDEGEPLPAGFLLATADAIESGEWSRVGHAFACHDFLSARGEFMLVGDLTQRRGGSTRTVLSLVMGRVVGRLDVEALQRGINTMFGDTREPVPTSLPVNVTAAAGGIGDEAGEAFIVPDSWGFCGSEPSGRRLGPSINDMGEQRRRFGAAGRIAIRRIFEPDAARLLLAPFSTDTAGDLTRAREYQGHEAGHASGLGLTRKIREGLLATPQLRGIEEFRADGVGLALAPHYLQPDEVYGVIASNLCTRFGLDAHRRGGVETDLDITASLYQFQALLEGGMLVFGPTGRLTFVHNTAGWLWQATEFHRATAVALTRRELRLTSGVGIGLLYGRLPLSDAVIQLFQEKVVDPCRGLYNCLR